MTDQELFDTSDDPPGPDNVVDIPEADEPLGDEEPAAEGEPDEPELEDESDLDPAG